MTFDKKYSILYLYHFRGVPLTIYLVFLYEVQSGLQYNEKATMIKKQRAHDPMTESSHFGRICRMAEHRSQKDGRPNPGMGDLLKVFLFDGPERLIRVAKNAGIDVDNLSYVDFAIDQQEEERLYGLIRRRAYEIASDRQHAKKVQLEHLFVALIERAAHKDCESIARKALLRQDGLDLSVVLASLRDALVPTKL